MTNFDDLKLAVEAFSGGKNTVLLDDIGMPSIVVPFPKLKYSDVLSDGTQDVLPAFIVDGEEVDLVYVSKYQNVVVNERAYSLPFKDPGVYIKFNQAVDACKKKGPGWHMNTNAMWAAIQHWCYKNKTLPHGNTDFGKDALFPYEKGVQSAWEPDVPALRTATGSGPATWYHNQDMSGIADLNGNVAEMVAGMQLIWGEIQIIPYGNAMKPDCDLTMNSPEWKAILQNGSLVAPGTTGTLKYDGKSAGGGIRINTAIEYTHDNYEAYSELFSNITPKSGITIPKMLRGLALTPASDYTYEAGRAFVVNSFDRILCRGHSYSYQQESAIHGIILAMRYDDYGPWAGFRAAFCEKFS